MKLTGFMGQRFYSFNPPYLMVCFLIFITSCVTQGEMGKAKVEPRLENLVEVQPATPSETFRKPETTKKKVKAPLLELTLPQLDLTPKKPPAKGPRFSLSAEEVDVKTILFALSKEIDQNIMIDPAISKKVTLNLSRVTLGEMLDHVLRPLNLQYEIDGEFIQVTELEMQTRVFHLNYLISRREGSGKLQASIKAPLRTSAVPGNASSQIFSSEETDLWQEISFGLHQMIGIRAGHLNKNISEERATEHGNENGPDTAGYVSINKQAGVVVVKAFPEDLLHVAEYLEEVEGSVQRQVFLQARIIKVVLKDEFQAGIDWSQMNSIDTPRSNEGLHSGGASRPARGFLSGEAQMDQMLATLSLQGDVSIIASPRIAALNNQRAVIRVGTEDTIFLPPTMASGVPTTTDTISRPVDFGVVIDVVPQINVNGNVMMSILTSVRQKSGERQSPDGQYAVPIVEVRESNNVVLARNGQTVVVGGMRKTEKAPVKEAKSSLRGVPILGNLFHQDRTGYERSELVILLTPEIMVGEAIDDRWRIEEKRLQRFGLIRHTQ